MGGLEPGVAEGYYQPFISGWWYKPSTIGGLLLLYQHYGLYIYIWIIYESGWWYSYPSEKD